MPKSSVRTAPLAANDKPNPSTRPAQGERYCLADDHAHDGRPIGAERKADTDFARALRHGMHQHAVNTNRRQEHGCTRKEAQQQDVYARLRDRIRGQLLHCPHTEDRQFGVEAGDDRAQRFDSRSVIHTACADCHEVHWKLRVREVDGGPDSNARAEVVNIACDTDNHTAGAGATFDPSASLT